MNIAYKNIILGISFTLFGYLLGTNLADGYFIHISDIVSKNNSGSTLSSDIFYSKKVREAYNYIEENYYGFRSKNKDIVEDALISSMAESLGDKHSNYFNEKEATKFIDALKGDFEGIGAVIHENIKGIQIMKVLPGSPAEKSGLTQGEIIIKVDGKSMLGVTADEAVNLIRGPKNSTVKLTIISSKEEKNEREVSIKRDTVNVPTVYSEVLSGTHIGYIELSMFGENTVDEFIKAFNTLSSSGVTGVVIDARNNGGGFLESAVELCSLLLPKNTVVVSTKGNNPIENMTLYTRDDIRPNTTVPLVFLVNNMSASATEITAGTLQENNRALVIGEKTYGKGSVQTPFTLSDGSILKLTTAKWYTPNGRSIDEKGIDPDIVVELTDDDYKSGYDRQLEGAKKLIQLQIEKDLSIPDLRKEAKTITF